MFVRIWKRPPSQIKNGEAQRHHWKLTWNLKMMVSKRNLSFQGSIFRFHVSFPESNIWKCHGSVTIRSERPVSNIVDINRKWLFGLWGSGCLTPGWILTKWIHLRKLTTGTWHKPRKEKEKHRPKPQIVGVPAVGLRRWKSNALTIYPSIKKAWHVWGNSCLNKGF